MACIVVGPIAQVYHLNQRLYACLCARRHACLCTRLCVCCSSGPHRRLIHPIVQVCPRACLFVRDYTYVPIACLYACHVHSSMFMRMPRVHAHVHLMRVGAFLLSETRQMPFEHLRGFELSRFNGGIAAAFIAGFCTMHLF